MPLARDPLTDLLLTLIHAEAELNRVAALLGEASDDLGSGKAEDQIRAARTRAFDARAALDAARLSTIGVTRLNGRALDASDKDDLGDALLHRLDQIQSGSIDDEDRVDSSLICAAERRGAAVLATVTAAA